MMGLGIMCDFELISSGRYEGDRAWFVLAAHYFGSLLFEATSVGFGSLLCPIASIRLPIRWGQRVPCGEGLNSRLRPCVLASHGSRTEPLFAEALGD